MNTSINITKPSLLAKGMKLSDIEAKIHFSFKARYIKPIKNKEHIGSVKLEKELPITMGVNKYNHATQCAFFICKSFAIRNPKYALKKINSIFTNTTILKPTFAKGDINMLNIGLPH
jgi:hypothetical protein